MKKNLIFLLLILFSTALFGQVNSYKTTVLGRVGDSGTWLCDVFKFSDENYTYLSFLTSTSQLDNIQIISLGEDIEIAQGSIENFLLICDTSNVNTNYEFHDGIKSLYTVHVIERCNKPELWFKFRGNTGVCIVTKRMLEDILTILYKN